MCCVVASGRGREGGRRILWEACSSKINFLYVCVSRLSLMLLIMLHTDLYSLHGLWGVLWVCVDLFRTGANRKVGLSVWDPSGWQVRLPYCQGILQESCAGMAIWCLFVSLFFFYIISCSFLSFVLSKVTGFIQVNSWQQPKPFIDSAASYCARPSNRLSSFAPLSS